MLLTGLFAITMLASPKLSAQWVVTDPTNFAQSIINTTQQIVQTSSTAKNMLNNFREVEKLYNQGKEYYDATCRRQLQDVCNQLQEDEPRP